MNRRAFIKGMVAAGVLLTTPLEGLCAVFRPKPLTATDILRKRGVAERVMENYTKALTARLNHTIKDKMLYGSSRGAGKDNTFHGIR